ncbi:MAG: hypothetical protein QNK15_11785 [Cycloclasticus sp.]|nr:hypothetical protein [Cycloclasticus sp.]
MPIWEILLLISVVVGISWIAYGSGQKKFRLIVGSSLCIVVVLFWGLAFSSVFSESVSYVLAMLALLSAVVLLFLPMVHKAMLKRNASA